MPSKTAKQKGLMAGCAHNPEKMRVPCPPRSVAREFNAADNKKKKMGTKSPGRR